MELFPPNAMDVVKTNPRFEIHSSFMLYTKEPMTDPQLSIFIEEATRFVKAYRYVVGTAPRGYAAKNPDQDRAQGDLRT